MIFFPHTVRRPLEGNQTGVKIGNEAQRADYFNDRDILLLKEDSSRD